MSRRLVATVFLLASICRSEAQLPAGLTEVCLSHERSRMIKVRIEQRQQAISDLLGGVER